jgi:hypothetical protein
MLMIGPAIVDLWMKTKFNKSSQLISINDQYFMLIYYFIIL